MPTAVTPTALGLAATLLTALAGLAFAWHWLGLGLAFLLLATPLDGIAERLASLRLQGSEGPSWWSVLLPVLAAGRAARSSPMTLAADPRLGLRRSGRDDHRFPGRAADRGGGAGGAGQDLARRAQGHDLADAALRRRQPVGDRA